MKVSVHARSSDRPDWFKNVYEFIQLPAVGEHCILDAHGHWYKVLLVVHCPFPTEYDAEIYAEQVDQQQVKLEIDPKPPKPMNSA